MGRRNETNRLTHKKKADDKKKKQQTKKEALVLHKKQFGNSNYWLFNVQSIQFSSAYLLLV